MQASSEPVNGTARDICYNSSDSSIEKCDKSSISSECSDNSNQEGDRPPDGPHPPMPLSSRRRDCGRICFSILFIILSNLLIISLVIALIVAVFLTLFPPLPHSVGHHSFLTEPGTSSIVGSTHLLATDETTGLGANPDELTWFVQISDLHINKNDWTSAWRLRHFVEFTLPIISPDFVVVTGDIVHSFATNEQVMRYKQREAEWREYRTILQSHNLFSWGKWMDLPGNHDLYTVSSGDSEHALFLNYSTFGKTFGAKTEVVEHIHTTQSGTQIRLIFLRNTEIPSVFLDHAFFLILQALTSTYFGRASSNHINKVEHLLKESSQTQHTLLLSHYCSNFINNPNWTPFLRELQVRDNPPFTALLCGHLHLPHTYARMQNGVIELELASFLQGYYRIVAFDHGLWTFKDSVVGEWPVVLITNPKNSETISALEPGDIMKSSTHIRALVFSPFKIKKVTVQIDGKIVCDSAQANPLNPIFYYCEWDPSKFAIGTHKVKVIADDAQSNSASTSNWFSLNLNLRRFIVIVAAYLLIPITEWLLITMIIAITFTLSVLLLAPFFPGIVLAAWRECWVIILLCTVLPVLSFSMLDAFPISCRTIVRATGKFSFLVLYTFIVLPWKQYLIPWRYKFPLLIAAIYPLVGPIGYGPNGLPGGWGVVLPWGISVGPQFKLAHTPWPFAYNLVFYLTILLPAGCSVGESMFKKHFISRGGSSWLGVKEIFLITLSLAGACSLIPMFVILQGAIFTVLSPLLWISLLPIFTAILAVIDTKLAFHHQKNLQEEQPSCTRALV